MNEAMSFSGELELIGSCAVGAPELSSLESSMYHAVLYQWVILLSGGHASSLAHATDTCR